MWPADENLVVRHDIEQTWPKCGPSTYFCGPWTSKATHFLPQESSKMTKYPKNGRKKFCFADVVTFNSVIVNSAMNFTRSSIKELLAA